MKRFYDFCETDGTSRRISRLTVVISVYLHDASNLQHHIEIVRADFSLHRDRNLLTPDLANTSNVKNYTRMASKSNKLRNLDFQAESPQTMPHNNDNDFLYY